MKERPIPFRAPMVRAILDGRKTQTRRVVKLRQFGESDTPGYDWTFRDRRGLWNDYKTSELVASKHNQFGVAGDRLWVRETWRHGGDEQANPDDRPSDDRGHWCEYRATDVDYHDCPMVGEEHPWRPSIHMPRWASRITLEVVSVRVERLQAISEEDAKAEGVESGLYRIAFAELWTEINGYGSWESNPWVWAVEFRRIK